MEEQKLISVVIPTYNNHTSVTETITSVLRQSYRNIEVIVVDDGSSHDYSDVIGSLGNNRIQLYRIDHKNANAARNYGINKSKGEFIAMLDDDDIWLASHLDECLQVLMNAGADGIYGSLILRNRETDSSTTVTVRKLKEREKMINYLLSTGYGAQTSTLFMTAVSAKAIEWDEQLYRHQDYDFVIRYNEKYKMVPKINPTVVYTLSSKTSRIDFESCIKVIGRNKQDIDPVIYNGYHRSMLFLANGQEAPKTITDHYRHEAVRYVEYTSYSQYILVCNPDSRLRQWICKIKYILYILRIVVMV